MKLSLRIQAPVTKIHAEVYEYHYKIYNVKDYDIGNIISDKFSDNTEYVTDQNKNKKNKTFSFCGTGCVRFQDRSRPGYTKAD